MLQSRRVSLPVTHGTAQADHGGLQPVLDALAERGTPALGDLHLDLRRYVEAQAAIDPSDLSKPAALAYWLNLYNAGALELAARAFTVGAESVLRLPGGFDTPVLEIAGEQLSLDAIEHGKIRRFGDPRVHAALVCGSVSCPTLRYETYRGEALDGQLDDQMRRFLSEGGAMLNIETRTVRLSRVFLWYGGDFTRPANMPTWLPARPSVLLRALLPWLDESASWIASGKASVKYQAYDWGLRCSVG